MSLLTLRYKGYSLQLSFELNSYYMRTPFEHGKTLYQLLFEHLIDGKTVSSKGIARHYKPVNDSITGGSVSKIMERIESALKASRDKRLRKKRFVTLPRGGASPVLERKSSESRFTEAQREVIMRTGNAFRKQGRKLTLKEFRYACINALNRKGLDDNVVFSHLAAKRYAKRGGLTLTIRRQRYRRRH